MCRFHYDACRGTTRDGAVLCNEIGRGSDEEARRPRCRSAVRPLQALRHPSLLRRVCTTERAGAILHVTCSPGILHLVPHAGGGVGTVLRALLTAACKDGARDRVAVASLESLNEPTRSHCHLLGISWADNLAAIGDWPRLDALVASSDVVLLHWWNHPLLMRLMARGLPPSRVVLWSHVNGHYPPQAFFRELFDFPDVFVMASEASRTAPAVGGLPVAVRNRLRVIRSCAGVPPWAAETCGKADPPRVGYVGTVEDAKMHAEFLGLCAAADLAEPCIVAGGPAHEAFRQRAVQLGLEKRFTILGHVPDPTAIYRRIHVFAYALNPRHYGTGEQVLIEAMAAGCVPVVLDNPPEAALVRHDETGLIARTPDDFSRAVRLLIDRPAERERLARAGRRFVLEECGIHLSLAAFQAVFEDLCRAEKRPHRLVLPAIGGVPEGTPCHLFLASCGETPERNLVLDRLLNPAEGEPLPASFRHPTRGSPLHYLHMLGPDTNLERLCRHANHDARRETCLHG